MTTTAILAVIGGITVILTAAARIPAALAEFLRACILVVAAARDLRDRHHQALRSQRRLVQPTRRWACRGLQTLVQTTSETDTEDRHRTSRCLS